MQVVVRASVVLAVAISLIIIAIATTGLHEKPMFMGLVAFILFTLINIVVIYRGLAETAGINGYGKQLGNAAAIGLLGGVLIALSSWILMSIVFPDYIEQASRAGLAWMESEGMSEAQIEQQRVALAETTPFAQALHGAFGTFGTSVIAGAVIAIFKRRR